jgi:hypothetical protein
MEDKAFFRISRPTYSPSWLFMTVKDINVARWYSRIFDQMHGGGK